MSSESTHRPVLAAGAGATVRPRSPPPGPDDSTWRRWRLDEKYGPSMWRKARPPAAVRQVKRKTPMASTERERVQRAKQQHEDGNQIGEKLMWVPETQTIQTVGPGGSGVDGLGYEVDKLGFSGREGSEAA